MYIAQQMIPIYTHVIFPFFYALDESQLVCFSFISYLNFKIGYYSYSFNMVLGNLEAFVF